jgi:hypothetical protein
MTLKREKEEFNILTINMTTKAQEVMQIRMPEQLNNSYNYCN